MEMIYDHYQDVIDRFPEDIHKLLMHDDYYLKQAEKLVKSSKNNLGDYNKKDFENMHIKLNEMVNGLGNYPVTA